MQDSLMATAQSGPLIRQVSRQAQCDANADMLKSNLATARRGIAGLLCMTQHKNRPAWLFRGVLTQCMWRFVPRGVMDTNVRSSQMQKDILYICSLTVAIDGDFEILRQIPNTRFAPVAAYLHRSDVVQPS